MIATYAIAQVEESRGGRIAYLGERPDACEFDPGQARKFNTPADAESHLRSSLLLNAIPKDHHRHYLRTLPDTLAVVGLLPWALAEAEAEARARLAERSPAR